METLAQTHYFGTEVGANIEFSDTVLDVTSISLMGLCSCHYCYGENVCFLLEMMPSPSLRLIPVLEILCIMFLFFFPPIFMHV